jgi:hypothetical protein
MRIQLSGCRYTLAILWFLGFGALAGILAVQQAFGYYDDNANDAWGWLLPNVVPTLSLMVGVLVAAQRAQQPEKETVDRAFFLLSLATSVIYLGLLLLTVLLQPAAHSDPLTLMDNSKLYLTPVQGLATGLLAAFFMSGSYEAAGTPGAGARSSPTSPSRARSSRTPTS